MPKILPDADRSHSASMTGFSERFAQLLERSRTDGLGGAVMLIAKNSPRRLRQWVIRRRMRQHEHFDLKYQVDTQMPVRVSDLETSSPGAKFANRYEGTPIAAVRKIIRRLEVDRHRFTFVDLGSGKGRVLLIAAQYPFRFVIGVEFSKRLHDIACSNIQKFVATGRTLTKIRSVNCDAAAFDFSDLADKVVFCYNPFAAELMDKVLNNLQQPARQPGETIFVYLGPMPNAISQKLANFPMIGKGEFLSEFGFFEQYSIYKMR